MNKKSHQKKYVFSILIVATFASFIFFSRTTFFQRFKSELGTPIASTSPTDRNDMLAAADVKNGLELSRGCGPCHSFTEHNEGKIGPNLLGVFGQKIARKTNYEYSAALKKHQGKTWTANELDEWLADPGEYAPGTNMAFGGVLDPQDRADLIAYIMSVK